MISFQYVLHVKLDVLGHSQRLAKEHQQEQPHKLFIVVASTACTWTKFHALVISTFRLAAADEV